MGINESVKAAMQADLSESDDPVSISCVFSGTYTSRLVKYVPCGKTARNTSDPHNNNTDTVSLALPCHGIRHFLLTANGLKCHANPDDVLNLVHGNK